jgi:pantothenate kinase
VSLGRGALGAQHDSLSLSHTHTHTLTRSLLLTRLSHSPQLHSHTIKGVDEDIFPYLLVNIGSGESETRVSENGV